MLATLLGILRDRKIFKVLDIGDRLKLWLSILSKGNSMSEDLGDSRVEDKGLLELMDLTHLVCILQQFLW